MDFAEPMPYFVDAKGVRCAMAHLLEAGGERELVQRIARERNNAFVRDLADESRLLAWLAAAGLTACRKPSSKSPKPRQQPTPRRLPWLKRPSLPRSMKPLRQLQLRRLLQFLPIRSR